MRFAAILLVFASLVTALPNPGQELSDASDVDVDISKRIYTSIFKDECSKHVKQLEKATKACHTLAKAAAKNARSGSNSRMKKFFKSSDSKTRAKVAANFERIADECVSNTGKSGFRCKDLTGQCQGDIYGYQTGTAIVICDPFYTWPLSNKKCDENTQAGNLIHEISHLDSTVGTSDYNGCYGLECALSLPAKKNLKHADTYRLYAQAVNSKCY